MGNEDLDPYDPGNYSSNGSFLGVGGPPEDAGESKSSEGNERKRRGEHLKGPPKSRARKEATETPASPAAREPARPSQRERNVPDVSRPESVPSVGPSGPDVRNVKMELGEDDSHRYDYTEDEIQIIPAVEPKEEAPEEDTNNLSDTEEDEIQIVAEVKKEVDAGETDRYNYTDDEIQILSSSPSPSPVHNETINIDEDMPTNTPSPGVFDPRGALRVDRRPEVTITQKSNSTPEMSSSGSGEVGSGDGGGTTKASQATTKSGHSDDIFDELIEGARREYERTLNASGDASQGAVLHEIGGLDNSNDGMMPDDDDDMPPPPPPHRSKFVVESSDSSDDSAPPPPPKRPLLTPSRNLVVRSRIACGPGRGRLSGLLPRKTSAPVKNKATGISRTLSVNREIDRLQRTTALQIPRLAFQRVVKDITKEVTRDLSDMPTPPRWQSLAMTALQEASEVYITQLMEDANFAAHHGGRVTVMPKDVQLVQRFRKK